MLIATLILSVVNLAILLELRQPKRRQPITPEPEITVSVPNAPIGSTVDLPKAAFLSVPEKREENQIGSFR